MTAAFAPSLTFEVGGDVVQVRCSTIADGDFHVDGPRAALLHRRAAFEVGCWTQPDEVHGTVVRIVDHPGAHDLEEADGVVTRCRGAVLAAWVGDCAPVVFVGDDGVIAAAHAGWSGALHGVLQATVAAVRLESSDTASVRAILGPCIHACCYEFGTDLLEQFAARFGSHVVGTTSWGSPALHMPAVVAAACTEVDVPLLDNSVCTGCHPELFYSHRTREQRGRQVMTVTKRVAA